MTGRPLAAISTKLTRIQTLYAAGTLGNQPDEFLLERFLADPAAIAQDCFAVLVERHGPMVYRACRQVLGNDHDAQDAFQATFLVLARRASTVRKRDSLGSWLYGIALRIAWRARANRIRLQGLERRVASRINEAESSPEAPEPGWPELHEEVDRLPRKFRDAVVLCYLEGLTTEAASRRLGCPQGTVLSRLARARARLKARLAERGLAIPAGFVIGGITIDSMASSVLSGLTRSLSLTAARILEGDGVGDVGSLTVRTLAEGMLRLMSRTRMIRSAASVLVSSLLLASVGVFIHATAAAPPGKENDAAVPKKAAAQEKAEAREPAATQGPGTLIVRASRMSDQGFGDAFNGLITINPETGDRHTIYRGRSLGQISPDGRFVVSTPIKTPKGGFGMGVWIHDIQGKQAPRRIFDRHGESYWSHDGRKVVITSSIDKNTQENWIVDADGTNLTRLPIPDTDVVTDCSRDGAWLATRTHAFNSPHRGRQTLVRLDGSSSRRLSEGQDGNPHPISTRFSPDGRSIACVEHVMEGKEGKIRVSVEDLDGKARRTLPLETRGDGLVSVTWSPDASRLAIEVMDNTNRTSYISIVNRDGTGLRRLPLPQSKWLYISLGWTSQASIPPLQDDILDNPVRADDPSSAGRYLALLKAEELEARAAEATKKRREAGHQDQDDDTQEQNQRLMKYAAKFLEVAEAAPDDLAAYRSLLWIFQRCWIGPAYLRALDLLAEKYADRDEVAQAALMHTHSILPCDERIFRAILAKNGNRQIQGQITMTLARYLLNRADRIHQARSCPEWARGWEKLHLEGGTDPKEVAGLFQGDPEELSSQAAKLFERVIREYPDVRGSRTATLIEPAQVELRKLREIAVGKPAPEICWIDLDEKPMRLDEFKGKAVVLHFWADARGPSLQALPDARVLEELKRDRPLVVLGVNCDSFRLAAKAAAKEGGMKWPSWFDGGDLITFGPIAQDFNVRGVPAIFLIDHEGVIRHKFTEIPGAEELLRLIRQLADEAAASK